MEFLWHGLEQAIQQITHPSSGVYTVVWFTLRVGFWSTVIGLVLGLPIGLALGLGRFRGRRPLLALFNAGLGLPPVVVGLVLTLLMIPQSVLGPLHLLYTPNGVIIAQSVLALPVIAALSAAAVQAVPEGLLAQARALGASRLQVARLALEEARVGVLAAIIAALGSALSEVGAVVLVGGNVQGRTETLASALLTRVSGGYYAQAMAFGIILLGLVLVVAAALTIAQQRAAYALIRRPS